MLTLAFIALPREKKKNSASTWDKKHFPDQKKTLKLINSFSMIKFWSWEYKSAYLEWVKRHCFLSMDLYWQQRSLFSQSCIFAFTSSTCVLNIFVIVSSILHGRHPTTVSLSLTGWRMKQSWNSGGNVDQSNTDFTDDITGRMDFFFQDCPQTPVYPQWWIFIGSPWGCRLPDTLWRTWFADNLVKTETAVLLWPVCFSVERHNVVGCPAAWKEKESNIYRSELILMPKECLIWEFLVQEKKNNIVNLSCSKPLPCQTLLY